jgi:hypothetical protein
MMNQVSLEAGSRPAVATKHRGVKSPGGAKRIDIKTARVQLHLGETTAKRLSVHAALVGRNASRVADDILSAWLGRFGKGRECFSVTADAEVTEPVE